MHSYAQNEAIIDPESTYQIIRGFGASNIMSWRPDMTTDEINTAFGIEDGQIGFSILRLRVPLSEAEFNINLPTARLAYSMGATLIASPWSPPADMKSNVSSVGGELEKEYYDDFAAHLKSFADYMAENDAPVYAVSVQNEPDVNVTYESCDWNASQMLKFVKENAPSIGIKVMAPESAHFDKDLSDPILNDSAACANLDIVAGHIYGGGIEAYPLAESKMKELWMTEHLILETDWPAALSTANDMNDCMRSGMSAYVWWYIVRFYGPISDGTNNTGNKGDVTKRGFVMSQFSRFIRSGYFRIACTDVPQTDVIVTAYKDSASSKVVIVAINNSAQAQLQTFTFQSGTFEKFTPYVTSATKNCSREDDIPLTDGSFSGNLEASSITTYVSSSESSKIQNTSPVIKSFNLYQNYPNPFNPLTRIDFEIKEKSFVSLKIYDLLGREIEELAGLEFSAGRHSVRFDGSYLPSGFYLYRLKTDDFVQIKKMLLLK